LCLHRLAGKASCAYTVFYRVLMFMRCHVCVQLSCVCAARSFGTSVSRSGSLVIIWTKLEYRLALVAPVAPVVGLLHLLHTLSACCTCCTRCRLASAAARSGLLPCRLRLWPFQVRMVACVCACACVRVSGVDNGSALESSPRKQQDDLVASVVKRWTRYTKCRGKHNT